MTKNEVIEADHNDTSTSAAIDDDYLTVTMLCAGLDWMLRRREGRAREHRGLLPPAWRIGFGRLWWRCHDQGVDAPVSDLELMQWCTRPLATWDVDLAISDTDRQHCLIQGEELSVFAEQAARMTTSADVEAEWVENLVFKAIGTTAAFNGGNDDAKVEAIYSALRRLLIDHPVLTDIELLKLEMKLGYLDSTGQTYVRRLIDHAYTNHAGANPHRYLRCPSCKNLRTDTAELCLTPGCAGGPAEQAEVQVNSRVYQQHRAVRRFIRDPGLVEARIYDLLHNDPELDGRVDVTAYPKSDTLDILIEFLDEDAAGELQVIETWGVDAKDQLSARLLGRTFTWPGGIACQRRILALPMHRANQFNYVHDLRAELEGRADGVEVVDEERLIDQVKRRARRLTK